MIRLNRFFTGVLFTLSVIGLMSLLADDTQKDEVLKLDKKYGIHSPETATYNPIVKIKMGEHGYCTAFVVDSNYAITAAHCLDKNNKLTKEPISIYSDKGEDTKIKAKAVGMVRSSDVGLINGDFSNFKNIKVEFNDLGIFPQKLYAACGFPHAQNTLTCNPVIPVSNMGFSMKGQGFLVPGMSGGPVIDLETSTVVALNSAVGMDGGVYVFPLQGFLGAFHLE